MNCKALTKVGMLATFCLSVLSGCTMCCQPHLDDYGAYGTRKPRVDRTNGRVGSPFSDPSFNSYQESSRDTIEIFDEDVSAVSFDDYNDEAGLVISAGYEID
jgi:hypothetical protein